MDTLQVLNANAYPSVKDNTRRKDFVYYDQQAIAAGTTDYYFFNTNLANIFARNKKFPIAGSEVFFVEAISAFIDADILTPANVVSLCLLLQQSYLLITVNNRTQCKLPLLDILGYNTGISADATPEVITNQVHKQKRKLPYPILINSTSAVEVKIVIPTQAATDFDTNILKLAFHGVQLDKLDVFYYDALKQEQYQKIAVTYYNTAAIANGNEAIFNLFSDASISKALYSQTFPLSDIQTFQLQNIEVLIGQPAVAIEPMTIYNSRLSNILTVNIDDVEYYNSNLLDKLSVIAGISGNLTTAGADTLAYNAITNIRQSQTLKIPVLFPAQGKVSVTLQQPASSLPITGNITVAFRGVETRRVA